MKRTASSRFDTSYYELPIKRRKLDLDEAPELSGQRQSSFTRASGMNLSVSRSQAKRNGLEQDASGIATRTAMRDAHESKSKSKSNASDVPSLFPQRGHHDPKQNVSVQSRKGLAMSDEGLRSVRSNKRRHNHVDDEGLDPSDAGFVGQPDKRARFTVESHAVKRDEAAVVKSKRRETTTKAKKQIPQKLPTAFQQRQVNPIYSPKRNSEREREDGEEGSGKQIKGADNKVAQERLKTPSCRPSSKKPTVGPSKAEVIVKGRTRSWAIQKEEAYEYAFRDLSTENGTILTLRAVLDDEFAIEYPHISLSRQGNDYLIKIEMLTRSEKIIRTDLNQTKQILRLCREKNGAGRRIKKQVGDEHGQPTRREAKKVKAPRKRPTIAHEKNRSVDRRCRVTNGSSEKLD